MKNKFIFTITCFVLSIIIFVALIILQQKLAHPTGEVSVYYSTRDIAANTEISENNIKSYFTIKNIDSDMLVDGAITNRSNLIGEYVSSSIVSGEQITAKRLNPQKSRTTDIVNLREYGINFSDISEVVGGTLNQGDVIDLMLTSSTSQQVTTEVVLKNVLIDKAIAADGQIVSRENSNRFFFNEKISFCEQLGIITLPIAANSLIE